MNETAPSTSVGALTPERTATDHTAVLLPGYRKSTLLATGIIPTKGALHMASYDGVIMRGFGWTTRRDMRLGDELPFFEVTFKESLYRIQARPVDGQDPATREDDLVYELVRTVSPGLKCDGLYMERPSGVPNTPRALVSELQFMTRANVSDLMDNAYSIFHYRLDHDGKYPDTMTPAGYTLRELLLLSDNGTGEARSLYDTPAGTNPELWTLFLGELDKKNPKLAAYVTSSMAVREFRENGVAAMREALKVRDPNALAAAVPMSFTAFLTAFPVPSYQSKLQRSVGTRAEHFYP